FRSRAPRPCEPSSRELELSKRSAGGRMTRFSSILRCWTVCLLCAFCASSDGPCTVLCALPQAFTVTVTSSVSGGPVPGAYVTGDPYGAGDGCLCNQAPGSTCYLPGFRSEEHTSELQSRENLV